MPLWGRVAWCHRDTLPQGCYALSQAGCDLANHSAPAELAENTKCLWTLAQTVFGGLRTPARLDNM
jgi:hypothetical protein